MLWQMYCSTLASFAGTCLQCPTLNFGLYVKDAYFASRKDAHFVPKELLQRWIARMVNGLGAESLRIREVVREALSSESSSIILPLILREVSTGVTARLYQEDDPALIKTGSPRLTVLIEQTISALRLILERPELEDAMVGHELDLTPLLEAIMAYIRESLVSSTTFMRLRSRFCQTCALLFRKTTSVKLTEKSSFQYRVLDLMMDWMVEAISLRSSGDDSIERATKELSSEAMTCIANILDGLSMADVPECADGPSFKRHQFHRYWRFLLGVLNKSRSRTKEFDGGALVETVLPTRAMQNQQTDMTQLKDSCIDAITNLIAANVDLGLPKALSMSLHHDPDLRVEFINSMERLLRRGAHINMLNVPKSPDTNAHLRNVLLDPNLRLAMVICKVCPVAEIDQVASVMLAYFESSGMALTMKLLKEAIELEVYQTGQCSGTLARIDSN